MQFLVHVGPPKTGTSAIQNWLVNNREWLVKKGYFYPEHEIDSNGVSSGNLLALYDRDREGNLTFNTVKLESIVAESKRFKCKNVLLSSEFFFAKIDELFDKLSDVLFLAYVRNPLELKESGYNQSIKRHGQFKKFPFEHRLPSRHLDSLAEKYSQLGAEHFKVRFYHQDMFCNGNIIDDFLSCLAIDPRADEVCTQVKRINTSYCAEAMEFKRWVNKLALSRKFDRELDIILQGFNQGTLSYSLIPPKYYAQLRSQCVSKLIAFREVCRVEGVSKFISVVREQSQKPYYSQESLKGSVRVISNYLYTNHQEYYKSLLRELKAKSKVPVDFQLLDVYKEPMPRQDRILHSGILVKVKSCLARLVGRIHR